MGVVQYKVDSLKVSFVVSNLPCATLTQWYTFSRSPFVDYFSVTKWRLHVFQSVPSLAFAIALYSFHNNFLVRLVANFRVLKTEGDRDQQEINDTSLEA